MDQWKSQIKFPFVYLDSSHIIRSGNLNIERISRKFIKKYPQTSQQILYQLESDSINDNLYYEKLAELKRQGKISSLITMETFNPILLKNASNTVFLFGKAIPHEYSNMVFWNENVDFRLYNTAAMLISNAKCIIADADFFTLSVGTELQKYVPSECTLIVSASSINISKIDGNYMKCGLPSMDIIHYLSFLE